MIRFSRLFSFIAAILVHFGVAQAAETRLAIVNGGEHAKYSRVVVDAPGVGYDLTYGHRRVRIALADPALQLDINRFKDKRPAHRVLDVRIQREKTGPVLELDMTCDCGAKVFRGRSGKVIIDIAESYPKNPTYLAASAPSASQQETKSQRAMPANSDKKGKKPGTDEDIVASQNTVEKAREKMVAMLSQAEQQGLISFEEQNVSNSALGTTLASRNGAANAYDKRSARNMLNADDATCRPDKWYFPIDAKANNDPVGLINKLRNQLVGEFDRANPDIVRELYWTYLSIGFGDEALSLLEAFPAVGEDLDVLQDIAVIVADRDLRAESDFLGSPACRGAGAVLVAVANARLRPEFAVELVRGNFELLANFPDEVVKDFAVRLGIAATNASDWTLAGHFKRMADFAGADTASFKFLVAEFERHRGREDKAREKLEQLATGQSERQEDALFALAEAYAARGEVPHEGFAEDMGMVAALSDDDDRRTKAVVYEAQSLISEGEFASAFRQIIRTYRETPGARKGLGLAARTLLVEAMENGDQGAQLAAVDAYFDFEEFIDTSAGNSADDRLHIVAAQTAISYSLPNVANYALERISGQVGDAAVPIRLAIEKLNSVTRQSLEEVVATSGASWPERVAELRGALSGEDGGTAAHQAAATAFLAGENTLPDDVRAALGDKASNYTPAFGGEGVKINANLDAEQVQLLVDQTAAEILLLREAFDGR